MNGYKCFWKHAKEPIDVLASTSLEAQTKATELFQAKAKRKKVKSYEVSVYLCEKDSQEVVHTPTE